MEKRIKVLHIGLCPNKGGIETVVHSWWAWLRENDFKIDGVAFQFDFTNVYDEPIAFEDEFKGAGSRIYHIPKRSRNPIGNYRGYWNVIREGKYDYVHCHVMSLSEPEPILIACEMRNRRKDGRNKPAGIIHSHTVINKNTFTQKRKFLHLLGKWRLRGKAYYRLACGEEAGRTMFGSEPNIRPLTKDFLIIENGIDLERYSFHPESRETIRNRYGVLPEDFVTGFVGRVSPQKNIPYLIASFAELKAHWKETECGKCWLMMVGDLAHKNILELIEKNGIRENVILTGAVADVSGYYSAMDMFYLPSLWEGVSVAMIEAQASGLPCIASENVSKESDVSGRVRYIKTDDVSNLYRCISASGKQLRARSQEKPGFAFDTKYDIRSSTEKVLRFYMENRAE